MKVFGLLALPLLAAASPVIRTDVFDESIAPLHEPVNGKHIQDSYLVVFKKHVTQTLAFQHHDWVTELHDGIQSKKLDLQRRSQIPLVSSMFAGLKHTYNIEGGLMGYSGHFDSDVIEHVRRHPDVGTIRWLRIQHTDTSRSSLLRRIKKSRSSLLGTMTTRVQSSRRTPPGASPVSRTATG